MNRKVLIIGIALITFIIVDLIAMSVKQNNNTQLIENNEDKTNISINNDNNDNQDNQSVLENKKVLINENGEIALVDKTDRDNKLDDQSDEWRPIDRSEDEEIINEIIEQLDNNENDENNTLEN